MEKWIKEDLLKYLTDIIPIVPKSQLDNVIKAKKQVEQIKED